MASLPESVKVAWEHRSGPVILATADEQSMPNAIYATCVALYDEATLVVADNYFDKTSATYSPAAGDRFCSSLTRTMRSRSRGRSHTTPTDRSSIT